MTDVAKTVILPGGRRVSGLYRRVHAPSENQDNRPSSSVVEAAPSAETLRERTPDPQHVRPPWPAAELSSIAQAPGCKPRGRIDGHRGRLVGWRNMGGYPTVCGARGNRIRSPDTGLTLGRRFDGLAPGPPPLPALQSRHRSFAGLPQAAGVVSMPVSLGSGGYPNSVPAPPKARARV